MQQKKSEGRNIHFIGIGGIGVSALARYYRSEGWRVSGSDATRSDITDALQKEGVRIFIGHRAGQGAEAKFVIHSAAIGNDNTELAAARRSGARVLSYAEAIGELTKKYYTIAVSGSHGKSTTTALIGLILTKAGLDPTVIVGTKLKEFAPPAGGANFRKGKGYYLVLEADEWNRSFYHYHPKIAVLTNIDREHLDIYKNYRGVVAGFTHYLKNVPRGGFIVANAKDKGICEAVRRTKGTVVFYNRHVFPKHPLAIPGRHNQLNAEAAWQAVKLLGVKKKIADQAFASYRGAWRRLERLEVRDKRWARAIVYSDYAHHPTEIKATLSALREQYPEARIVCVYEPHQQDRLTRLFVDFTRAFAQADQVILLPVYRVKGRDQYGKGKTSRELAKAIVERHAHYADDFKSAVQLLKKNAAEPVVVVFMGAGNIDRDVRNFFDVKR